MNSKIPNYPPPVNYGHPGHYMPPGAFNMYPESAFTDTEGDKPTREVADYNIWEAWRDTIMFTCLDIAVMGTAWTFQMMGFLNGYYILIYLVRIANIVAFVWLIGHFAGSPEWMKIKGWNRKRIVGRILLFLVGCLLSHFIFYAFWAR